MSVCTLAIVAGGPFSTQPQAVSLLVRSHLRKTIVNKDLLFDTLMPLITLDNISIGFRGPNLMDDVSANIDEGQKIGLLGRNGVGKTTLMKMLVGETVPDNGNIRFSPGTKVAYLTQDVPGNLSGSVKSVVLEGQPTGIPKRNGGKPNMRLIKRCREWNWTPKRRSKLFPVE